MGFGRAVQEDASFLRRLPDLLHAVGKQVWNSLLSGNWLLKELLGLQVNGMSLQKRMLEEPLNTNVPSAQKDSELCSGCCLLLVLYSSLGRSAMLTDLIFT